MSDLARVVAYVFRRQGRDSLPRNEFKQILSFRLNWYPPAQASQIVDRALRAGLLVEDGEALRLAFPAETVEMPVDYRGGARALDEPLPEVAAVVVHAAVRPPAPERPDPALVERAHALRAMAHDRLSEEAALHLAGRERGREVRSEAAALLAKVPAAGGTSAGGQSS